MSIDNLKTILNHNISWQSGNTGTKVTVYIDEENPSTSNCIVLYENNDNSYVSTSKAPYYRNGIQVVARHLDKTKARIMNYNALEYINARRKTLTGVYFIPNSTPIYLGKDTDQGGHLYSFNVYMKGAK